MSLRLLHDEMLVEFLKDVRIEEWLLGTLGVARIKVTDIAETLVLEQRLADVVILFGDFEIRVSLLAFFREVIVIPRVSITDLFLGQADLGRAGIVRHLHAKCILRLGAGKLDVDVHRDGVGRGRIIVGGFEALDEGQELLLLVVQDDSLRLQRER